MGIQADKGIVPAEKELVIDKNNNKHKDSAINHYVANLVFII